MDEPVYEVQSGREADDACWLNAILEREAELEKEGLRASFPASDTTSSDLGTPTICPQCGASFNTEDQFKSHIPPNPHKCCFPSCDRSPFRYPKDLRRHINDVHTTTSLYKCSVDGCRSNYSFKRRDNLQRHIRKQHPQVSA